MEASKVAKRVLKGRWLVVFVTFLIMSCAGGTYIFGVYSEEIKTVLGYDQQTLTTVGFFKDLGANIGIISGLINEVMPPWVVLAIGAVMNLTGYLMVWLSITQRIAKPSPWQMYVYICIGANSQTFANTGSLVTCVKNFPKSRGIVLGIVKGYVGLSGAFFTQIYHALYGHDATSVILLLGWLPTAVSLFVMFIVRPINVIEEKGEQKCFYRFLYIALSLAVILMALIIVENRNQSFPRFGYQIVSSIILLFLLLNIVVVIQAETDALKFKSAPVNSNHELEDMRVDGDLPNKEEKEEKEEITEHRVSVSMASRCGKTFKGPKRGEDFTIPQALVSVDMIIIFIASICGVGSTLTAIDNMGQIGKSLGYTTVNISTFVSLISIWNFLGRVVAGFLSEILLQRYRFPRTLMFTITLLVACVGHLFIAFALPGSLYVASVVIGLCFGAFWSLMFAMISELFGLKYYATLYNFGAASSPLGSYLLSVRTVGVLYDKEARKQNGLTNSSATVRKLMAGAGDSNLTCMGRECFRLSFIIMTGVTLFGALVSGILVLRTRKFYNSDIYAKFDREMAEQEREVEG